MKRSSFDNNSSNVVLLCYMNEQCMLTSCLIHHYRYLISGDSEGDILAWRCDNKGWYQLLRKFKRESALPPGVGNLGPLQQPTQNTGGGILSLCMHPDKHKGQLLALSRQPAQLRVINMSTYKTHSSCSGYGGYVTPTVGLHPGGIFTRAQFSADGRYAVAGSSVKGEDGLYHVRVWETSTGHSVRTPLSGERISYWAGVSCFFVLVLRAAFPLIVFV
jgi:hypothetical protein